jgi:hypothetical protein
MTKIPFQTQIALSRNFSLQEAPREGHQSTPRGVRIICDGAIFWHKINFFAIRNLSTTPVVLALMSFAHTLHFQPATGLGELLENNQEKTHFHCLPGCRKYPADKSMSFLGATFVFLCPAGRLWQTNTFEPHGIMTASKFSSYLLFQRVLREIFSPDQNAWAASAQYLIPNWLW